MKVAIHSVFIVKENILFLEEWIDYHIQIGFDVFYLYDNSKVNKKTLFDEHNPIIHGKVNKQGINYDTLVNLTDDQVSEILSKILERYKDIVYIIEWSPVDENGFICYHQQEAHTLCLSNLKQTDIIWCASIDIDEFIVLNTENIKTFLSSIRDDVYVIHMRQQRFESRFSNLDKNVVEIDKVVVENLPKNHSNKYIYNVNKTSYVSIHSCIGTGTKLYPNISIISFNHYKMIIWSHTETKTVNNINPDIKDIICDNSKNYVIRNYTPYPSS